MTADLRFIISTDTEKENHRLTKQCNIKNDASYILQRKQLISCHELSLASIKENE
jgi:hypothetical protein